jgi:uncharacterized iron-regulated membrane protein
MLKSSPEQSVLAPSILYQSVAEALPQKKIHSVWYHGENRTAQFSLDSDSIVYVNPYTAEVVAMVDHEDFFHFIDEGHFHLWFPEEIGEPIVGWGTLIFFILLVTGIVLWWPKKWNKKGREQSFKIKWKAKFKRVNYDLHNVLGFYSLLLALLMAITALIMSFAWFSDGFYWVTGGQGKPYKKKEAPIIQASTRSALQNADLIWRKVTTEIGQYNKDQVIVSFNEKPDEPIYACTDMTNGYWRDLYFNPANLTLLPSSNQKLQELPFADQVRKLNYSLHVGAFGGMPTKIMYFLASLICASLPITGFYIWWGKKKKTKKTKPKPVLI